MAEQQSAADDKIKEADIEAEQLINSIPGGIASYRVEGTRFVPTFFSDGVLKLSGHTRNEYEKICSYDALNIVYEADRSHILTAARAAITSGEILDISYRIWHKDGYLVWIHLNGQRIGPLTEQPIFYAVFTRMSSEIQIFRDITSENADGIYIINKENYELIYVNEFEDFFHRKGEDIIGQKCFQALCHRETPCEYCTLHTNEKSHRMSLPGTDRIYSSHSREMEWNGIPAYIKYVRDVTEEVKMEEDRERLEQYFQMMVKNLPGGVAVVRYEKDGSIIPEFMSEGFAAMTEMTIEEAWQLYQEDALAGLHPEDRRRIEKQMQQYTAVDSTSEQCEMVYRLLKGDGRYVWVKNTLSLITNENGIKRVYAVYHDMTKENEEQENLRRQYNDLIIQHYQTPGPNAVIVGHCNITQGKILEINDYTQADLRRLLSRNREQFFLKLSEFIVDEQECRLFVDTFLKKPALQAFERGETEKLQSCFIQIPGEEKGRYVQFKMNMVKVPYSCDVVGILTVADITEQTVQDRILHRLSITGYDFVVDVDLTRDWYHILSSNANILCLPPAQGCHSKWIAHMAQTNVVPRDREIYLNALEPKQLTQKLEKNGTYTFSFSTADDNGNIRMMNMTVSAIDLRLGRICLLRTDITDSVREQQGLLNMLAYTFELACFLDLNNGSMTMYTRETVMKNLPPYFVSDYETAIGKYLHKYLMDEDKKKLYEQFQTAYMLERLDKESSGYDFMFTRKTEEGIRYKRANVMWGDINHRTICMVRADVTDMLEAELESKRKLEQALVIAEKANQAKSDFLSAMSHDIRTPMNAVMGMTTLALAHLDEPDTVRDYLQKITRSSRHLLDLINDILDMSKIEHSKTVLTRTEISIAEFIHQISDIILPQIKTSKLHFKIEAGAIRHEFFYGDRLHINQILINILGNAVKFTPEHGQIKLQVTENESDKGDNWGKYCFTISDTGVGMSEEFMQQLFEPFVRSKQSIQDCVEGTGLGLSIVKGLVDQMGGTIQVESRLKKGSVFRVTLDLECVPARKYIQNHSFHRMLLAVSDTEECSRIGEALSSEGIIWISRAEWSEMKSGEKMAQPVELVLMDKACMLETDEAQFEGLHKLQVPFILLVTDDSRQEKEQAKKLGIKYFMDRPFFRSAFNEVLNEIQGVDSEEPVRQNEFSLEGCHFLVAEDNQINAEILSGLMQMCGAQVTVRTDGIQTAEEFEKAPTGTYDAILMDIQMPNMNGYEATRLIREMPRPDAGTIPVIAMTANAFAEDVQAAKEAGMNAHIAKPIDLNILKETLGKILKG